MAAEIKQEFSFDTNLVEGSRGIFDVKVDGRLVYSKANTHRFPEVGEMNRIISSS